MTPREIAEKYVYGRHNALTDKQEIEDMVKDIESLSVPSAMGRFSDSDVRNIVLDMENYAMFAHTRKLSRFETRAEFKKVKAKWGLNAI